MNMESLSKILEQLMLEKRISEIELSRQTSIGQPVINRILSGETQSPRPSTLQALADFFNITIEQLNGRESLPSQRILKGINQTFIPVLPVSNLTNWLHSREKVLDGSYLKWIATTTEVSSNAFAVLLQGKILAPMFIEGTILIFDPTLQARDGDFVVIELQDTENKILIKEYITDGAQIYLKSPNPDIKTIHVTSHYKILGVMTQARLSMRKDQPKLVEEVTFVYEGKNIKGQLEHA